MTESLDKKTTLFDHHTSLGARMVPFAGYAMPVQYQSIKKEHLHVRKKAGLFDVSHMGIIDIEGSDCIDFLNRVCTKNFSSIENNEAVYNLICNQEGFALDDVIAYKVSEKKAFIISNASNKDKIFNHLNNCKASFDVNISNKRFETHSIIAFQGPSSINIFKNLIPQYQEQAKFHFQELSFQDQILCVAHTGYTGESGVEIICPNSCVTSLWKALEGDPEVEAIGLGARDTLRTEMGYALYGQELNESINPYNASLFWTIDLKTKENCPHIGFEAHKVLKKNAQFRLMAIKGSSARAPRPQMKAFLNDEEIGTVSSGTYSPSLECGIGLAFLRREAVKPQDVSLVEIEMRAHQKIAFEIGKSPLYKV